MKKEAIILLAGSIKQDETGKWVSADHDHSGYVPSYWRVVGTYFLWSENRNRSIVCAGGYPPCFQKDKSPSVASVVKEELVALGVPETALFLENNSRNTYEQIKNSLEQTIKLQFDKVIFITNDWAIPRVNAFLSYYLDDLRQRISVEVLATEDLLLSHDSTTWTPRVAAAAESSAYKERVTLEEQGITDIMNGSYKF